MLIQIGLGTAIMIVSLAVAGLSFAVLESGLARMRRWLVIPPHRPKMFLSLAIAIFWVVFQTTVSVWLWAFSFMALGIFETLEPAVYFALVAFTTLGFGDILLPDAWRLLGGMASINGLVNIGIVTAFLIETLREVRMQQRSQQVS